MKTILDKIDHEVELTEHQKEEVLALLTERSAQIDKIKTKAKATELKKETLKTPNEQAYNKPKKVLTEEQYATFQALREETGKQKEMYPTEQLYQSEQDVILDF